MDHSGLSDWAFVVIGLVIVLAMRVTTVPDGFVWASPPRLVRRLLGPNGHGAILIAQIPMLILGYGLIAAGIPRWVARVEHAQAVAEVTTQFCSDWLVFWLVVTFVIAAAYWVRRHVFRRFD